MNKIIYTFILIGLVGSSSLSFAQIFHNQIVQQNLYPKHSLVPFYSQSYYPYENIYQSYKKNQVNIWNNYIQQANLNNNQLDKNRNLYKEKTKPVNSNFLFNQKEKEYIINLVKDDPIGDSISAKKLDQRIYEPYLSEKGIKQIIGIGVTDFTGSSPERIHNIKAAVKKFHNYIIPQESTFSFNNVLKNVSTKSGFVMSKVFAGGKTTNGMGGGVCQVSTTMFRTAYNTGLPIIKRKAHTIFISFYVPIGLDATIFLNGTDLQFKNDTTGDILIQGFIDKTKVYIVFYGTDDRHVWLDFLSREGSISTGLKSVWKRTIQKNSKTWSEKLVSKYLSPR